MLFRKAYCMPSLVLALEFISLSRPPKLLKPKDYLFWQSQ